MVVLKSSILVVFILKLVSAVPYPSSLGEKNSTDITRLTLRSDNYHDYGYVGTEPLEIAPRATDNSSCIALSADALKQLPGWSTFQTYVSKLLGNGSVNIVTNPSDMPGQGAVLCAQTDPVIIQVKGNLTCSHSTMASSGSMINANGSLRLIFQQGFTNTATWSVTQESQLAVGSKFFASIDIPNIAALSGEGSIKRTVTNENTQQFATSVINQMTQELWMTLPTNSTCQGFLNVTTCSTGGEGKIMLSAMGTAWWNFNDRVGPAGASADQKHYKWGFNILSVLTNIADRSSWITVTGDMTGESKGEYYGICT